MIVLSLIAYEVRRNRNTAADLPARSATSARMADAEPLMLIEAAPKIEEVAPPPEPIFEEAPHNHD